MITMSPINNIRQNQVKFTRKNNSTQQNNESNKTNTGVSKTVTGLMSTAAFLAGMQVQNYLPSSDKKLEPKEILAQNPAEKPDSTLTWNEALQRTNLAPREGRRDWYTTTTFSENGKDYTSKNHYLIQETPYLMDREITQNDNGKVVQRNTYSSYEEFPQKQKIVDGEGNIIEQREFTGFNPQKGCAEKGFIITGKTDGSTVRGEILDYYLHMQYGEPSEPKQKPKVKKETPKTNNTQKKNDNIDMGSMLDFFGGN